MIPYADKIINTVRGMLLKLPFAKSPSNESSLNIPRIISGKEVLGNIKINELSYRITAINDFGETKASDEFNISVGSMLDNVNIIGSTYTQGILSKGVYNYGVTAVNENGETNILKSFEVINKGAPAPDWADNNSTVTVDGQLPAGVYFYAVTAVLDNKETDISTFLEVNVGTENSSVTIEFLAVEGANEYRVYGRNRSIPRRIGVISNHIYTGPNQVIQFKDNGTTIPTQEAPTFNQTTAGINIIWEPITGNPTKYRIYGRASKDQNELGFLAEVDGNRTSYKDQGFLSPGKAPPQINESGFTNGVGIELRWNPIANATGYRIYGRRKSYNDHGEIKEEKGLLVTINGQTNTTFTDIGILTPDLTIPYPKFDSTDGTRGFPGVVIPDGETIIIDSQTGLLSVKGGIDSFLGRSDITNAKDRDVLVYNEHRGLFVNQDLKNIIFTLITMTDGTVVPIDAKFKEYQNSLLETLNELKTYKEQITDILANIQRNKEEIERLKSVIGNPFQNDLLDNRN